LRLGLSSRIPEGYFFCNFRLTWEHSLHGRLLLHSVFHSAFGVSALPRLLFGQAWWLLPVIPTAAGRLRQRQRGHQSFQEASLLNMPAAPQRTRIQRLSPKNKGGFPYILFRAGYRNGAVRLVPHVITRYFTGCFDLWGEVTFCGFQITFSNSSLSLFPCSSHHLPSPPCLPATFPPLMLRLTSGSQSIFLL
jgi:hypothetical protein